MTMKSEPVRVRDMPMEEIVKLLRVRGREIATLGQHGDRLAQAVESAYRYLYDHPGNPQAGANLRAAIEDYMNRDLRLAELGELGDRYGHRLPEPEKPHGERVFVCTLPSTLKQ